MRLAYGWRIGPPKRSRTLDFSRVLWCGKQDLNSEGVINAKKEHSKMDNPVTN